MSMSDILAAFLLLYHDGSYKTKTTRVAEPRQAKGKLPTETNKPNKKQEH